MCTGGCIVVTGKQTKTAAAQRDALFALAVVRAKPRGCVEMYLDYAAMSNSGANGAFHACSSGRIFKCRCL